MQLSNTIREWAVPRFDLHCTLRIPTGNLITDDIPKSNHHVEQLKRYNLQFVVTDLYVHPNVYLYNEREMEVVIFGTYTEAHLKTAESTEQHNFLNIYPSHKLEYLQHLIVTLVHILFF